MPPVSVVLARRCEEYVAALEKCAHVGAPEDGGRQVAVVDWLWLFDAAMGQAADRAVAYCDDVAELQQEWRQNLASIRANSSVDRLLRVLPGSPVLTVESASQLVGVHPNRVGSAVNALVEAGVLEQRNVGRERYRLFESPAVLDLWAVTDAELVGQRLSPSAPDSRPPGLDV